MQSLTVLSLLTSASLLMIPCAAQTSPARDYPVKPVPFTAVKVKDSFWAPKIETNRKVTIPFAFEQCEKSGRIYNFERAAKVLRGETVTDLRPPGYPFDDTDPYKVIEGASYALSVTPDPQLDAYVDTLIAKIGAAQEKDGYLYTTRTINPQAPHPWAGKERWELEQYDSHELYNLGHLYEAAAAHYQATGKRTLLDIAIRTADLLVNTFGPGKKAIWPGHQITEMGLVKLYRVTGNQKYLDLAKFLLDVRGPKTGMPRRHPSNQYNQSFLPVIEQTEPVGHAVRATYMYSGMADVAAMTGDFAYVNALNKIWDTVVQKKLYITGGIGASGAGEAFGGPYELPNMTAYNETCASIGNDYWNHRMFLLHADAKYIDVMERTLYNGLISGVSLDGKSFFYPNPLESNGQHQRSPWFGVACCPGNITRFLASFPGYMYGYQGDKLYVNLYAAGEASIKMDGGREVRLTQETKFPWEGAVKIGVEPSRAGNFTVNVRIPGWARDEAVPSDLYRFSEPLQTPATVKVNGRSVPMKLDKGYVAITRNWRKGDTIEVSLPMPVRRVLAHEKVTADKDRVALQRGPFVYAAEWADNPGGKVRNLMLPANAELRAEWRPDLLNGVTVIKSRAVALSYDAKGAVQKKEQEFTAIPYYAWANRGRGQMIVWLPTVESAAKPSAWPTVATTSKLVATPGRQQRGKNPAPIIDGEEPTSSIDNSSYFDWWPTRGTTESIEMTFAKTETVSEAQIYWFDDTGRGQVRVPQSWRLLYKDGNEWKPVENPSGYGVAKDTYNKVTFKPVTTSALKLEVVMQPQWSAGLSEWKVK